MQHVGVCRYVLRVASVLSFIVVSLGVSDFEDLLSAQDAHEASASKEFVKWCEAAKSMLTDRITARKESINQLSGAMESYSERADELKTRTKLKGVQAFNSSAQEQRLELIRTESEHWRSIHAKQIAEHLLEADSELLSSLDSILEWEEQATSQHQVARQQLLALVHEGHFQQIPNSTLPAVVTHSEASVQNLTQPPSSPPSPPVQEAPQNSASPAAAVSKAVTVDELVPTVQSERPHPSVVRASSAAVLQVPAEIAPLFGISQLPALQLMQADSPKVEVVPQAATLVSPVVQKSASELIMPESTGALPESTEPSPLMSLAGMSSGATTQAASALKEISSQLVSARQASPAIVEDPATKPVVEEPATKPAAIQEPTVPPQVTPAPALKLSSPISQQPRKPVPQVVSHPPKELVSAIPKSASSQKKTESISQSVPLATTLAAAVEKAIPMPLPLEQAPTSDKSAQKQSLIQSAALNSATQDSAQDDSEDALMAIMTGGSAAATSTSSEDGNTVPAVTVAAPTSTKPSAAFLAIKAQASPAAARHPTVQKVAPTAAPLPVAGPDGGPEDPEDALMEVMLQGKASGSEGSADVKPPARQQADVKPPARQHPAVLAQTAQQVHSTSSSKQRTTPKQAAAVKKTAERPVVEQKPVPPDSTAGVMKNFIQEVSDLAQGEPGDAQADPAEPVKKQQQEEKQESEATMMNSFVQEVTRLAQGEPTPPESKVANKPTTAAGLALSSDLASLMGLADSSPPASFLQLTRGGRRNSASSRSELAAAALIKDLDSSEVSKRLARTVEKNSVGSNIAMLGALREQLEGYQFKWSCSKGAAVARTNAVLQLAETGTSLLMLERSTVSALSAELRDAQASSAQLRAQLVANLQQTIGQGYEQATSDLQSMPLAQLQSASAAAASALVAFESSLRADAAEAKRLAAQWVDKGSAYTDAREELAQTSEAKDGELKQAQRVLADARTRAASGRNEVAKDPGCSEAVHTSGLIAAVYRALDILQG